MLTSDVGLNWRVPAHDREQYQLISKRTFTPDDLSRNPILTNELPEELMLHLSATLNNQYSVPDILMYRTKDIQTEYEQPRREHIFTIIEIKYCRDTRPEDQWARAVVQHSELAQALQNMPLLDCDSNNVNHTILVEQENILLGVTGGIFKNTADTLRKLGICGQSLNDLLKELHFVAVNGVEQMWRHRQAIIAATRGSRRRKRRYSRVQKGPRHLRSSSPRQRVRMGKKTGIHQNERSGLSTANTKRKYSQREPPHRKQKRAKSSSAASQAKGSR